MAGPLTSRVWLKRALLLIVIGMIVELFSLIHVTPGTFLLFAFFGVGPVVVGLALFVYAVTRASKQEGNDGG